MSTLTGKERKRLHKETFCIQEKSKYPIPDETHARVALSYVSQYGTPEEKRRVRACVHRKYPNIKLSR